MCGGSVSNSVQQQTIRAAARGFITQCRETHMVIGCQRENDRLVGVGHYGVGFTLARHVATNDVMNASSFSRISINHRQADVVVVIWCRKAAH